MTGRDRILLLSSAASPCSAASGSSSSRRSAEAKAVDAEVATQQQRLDSRRRVRRGGSAKRATADYATVALLGKAVPGDDESVLALPAAVRRRGSKVTFARSSWAPRRLVGARARRPRHRYGHGLELPTPPPTQAAAATLPPGATSARPASRRCPSLSCSTGRSPTWRTARPCSASCASTAAP